MKTLCEVSWDKGRELKEGESSSETGLYYLLHWGIKIELINGVGVNYTVAICQEVDTGDVFCFLPEQLKIIGTKI
jgi:hypothetical protein